MKTNLKSIDPALLPRDARTLEPRPPISQPGYYPGFSTLSQSPFWDHATRQVVDKRVQQAPSRRFFSESSWRFWTVVFEQLVPQADRTTERQIPLIPMLDERLAANRTVGYRYEDMPQDRIVYEIGIEAINREAEHRYGGNFLVLQSLHRDEVLKVIAEGKPQAAPDIWRRMSVKRFWQIIMADAIDAYYAHPWAWDEIGFGGPAYPRAYTRLERGEPEPWEVEEHRYEWLAPTVTVSSEVDASGDDDQAHHGSGGTH